MTDDKKNIVRKPRSNRNYINGPDFQKSIVDYYEACKNNPNADIPRYIGECILLIATKLATKINFSSYSYREEMEADAIEKMVEAIRLRKYDVTVSQNPLGYYTQVAYNCFLQRIGKEKVQASIKIKNLERLSLTRDDIPAVAKSMRGDVTINTDLELDLFLQVDGFQSNTIAWSNSNSYSPPEDTPKKSKGYTVHRNLSYDKNRKKKLDSEEKID